LFRVLPDSKGCIHKLLFHHAPIRQGGVLVREGIFGDFLGNLALTGVKPDVLVLATYENEDEKDFLADEAKCWRDLTGNLGYMEVMIDALERSRAPYPQDTCIVLDSDNPSFITSNLSKSKAPLSIAAIEKLLVASGLQDVLTTEECHLEGGYFYATTELLFYSDPYDRKIVESFEQEAVFVEDLINPLLEQILSILVPGGIGLGLPCHVDLMLSALEREDVLEVFCVDFREITSSSPLLTREQTYLLGRRFDAWDRQMKKVLDGIRSKAGNVEFHEVPGFLDLGPPAHVHSGANLLFHSTEERDYAFYLKFPREIEDESCFQVNKILEETLKETDVTPIPVSGKREMTNLVHISNSAGFRCLVKVLARI